jgi:hypothetical protein
MNRQELKTFAQNKPTVLAECSFGIFFSNGAFVLEGIVTNDTEKELMITGNRSFTECTGISGPNSS